MKTVLITGGSGLVGRKLTKLLIKNGYEVIWYSRERYIRGSIPRYKWDYRNGYIDKEALEKADYIIHLAGANIGDDRWTNRRKKTILESRVKTTNLLLETLKEMNKTPEVFVSASAVGYYGLEISDNILTEDDVINGTDFLSTTCQQWEEAADKFSTELNIRTVKIRTAFVLSSKSEALKKMMLPARFGLGSPLGKGKQYFSWIHIDDLCNIYIKAIEDNKMNGVFNAVAPDYTTNAQFMRQLSRTMNRPFFLPHIPTFALRIVMGEAADMILGGSRISSDKIRKSGFQFQYDKAVNALSDILNTIKKKKTEYK